MAYTYETNAPCGQRRSWAGRSARTTDPARRAGPKGCHERGFGWRAEASRRSRGRRDAPRRRPARDACRERKRRKRRRALRRRDSKTHARVRRACDDTARESKETGIANMSVVAKRLEENKASGGFFVFFFMHTYHLVRVARRLSISPHQTLRITGPSTPCASHLARPPRRSRAHRRPPPRRPCARTSPPPTPRRRARLRPPGQTGKRRFRFVFVFF